jgi:hypothetical protein
VIKDGRLFVTEQIKLPSSETTKVDLVESSPGLTITENSGKLTFETSEDDVIIAISK